MAGILGLTRWLTNALRTLVAGAVVVFYGYMVVAVLVQVLGRYVFNYSIDWATETATFAQIWMVLLAAGVAMRKRLHVGVDALVRSFPVALQRIILVVTVAVCLWFLGVAVQGSFRLIKIGLIQTSPALGIPMWLPYLSLPIGLTYFAFELVLATADRWRAARGLDTASGERSLDGGQAG